MQPPQAKFCEAFDLEDAVQRLALSPAPSAAGHKAPHVFISHAGEQKLAVVDHIRAGLTKSHPELDVFVDEWTLEPGDYAKQRMVLGCQTTSVGVLLLSPQFVRKKWPMLELRILLQRWQRQQQQRREQQLTNAQPQEQVLVVPVLYGLTVEQLSDMRWLYDSEPWCVGSGKPSQAVLDQWAADLAAVTEITMIRQDQVRLGESQLVDAIVRQVVKFLGTAGRLPSPTLEVRNYASADKVVAFVGRHQELLRAHEALLTQRYAEIRGGPGEGKSTLAQHLVRDVGHEWGQLRQDKAGGKVAYVLEVDMTGVAKCDGSEQDMRNALAAKLLAMVREEAQDGQWQVLLDWLRRQVRVLILLENAEEVVLLEGFSAVLEGLLVIPSVHLAVCTRIAGGELLSVTQEAVVELALLTEADGLEVIEAHLGPAHGWRPDGVDKEAARQLVRLVEGNPLVLSVAASLVRSRDGLRWQEVLERAHQGLAAVQPRVRRRPGGMGYHMTLLHQWLRGLLSPQEQQVLAALAVFAGSFSAGGAAAVAGCDDPEDDLLQLTDASLVRKHAEHGAADGGDEAQPHAAARYSMHALVKAAAAMLNEDAALERQWAQAFVHWVLLHPGGPGQSLRRSAPGGAAPDVGLHLLVLRQEVLNFGAVAVRLTSADLLLGSTEEIELAVCRVALLLSQNGHGRTAVPLLERAEVLIAQVLGAEHRSALRIKRSRARVQHDMGADAQAMQLLEEVLDASTRVLGPEHEHTLDCKSLLVTVMRDLDKSAAARLLQEEVLEGLTLVHGPYHSCVLTAKSNLAGIMRDLGNREESRQLEEEVLVLRLQVLGPEHPLTLCSMNQLAVALQAMGEVVAARRLHQEVLEVRVRVLGPEHVDTLVSKVNLGTSLYNMGDLTGARQLLQETVSVHVKVLGPDHPHTVGSQGALANVLWAMGELQQARQLHEEVLDAFARRHGPNHRYTLMTQGNLALHLRSQLGDTRQARQLEEEVLEAHMHLLGPEHPETLLAKGNLAVTLRAMGQLEVARLMEEEALEARTRVLGPDHADTIRNQHNLAETMRAMGQLREARRLHEEALATATRTIGPEHVYTRDIIRNLASTVHAMEQLDGMGHELGGAVRR